LGADQEIDGNTIIIEEENNQNWEEETTKTCNLSSNQKDALTAAVTKATPTPPEGNTESGCILQSGDKRLHAITRDSFQRIEWKRNSKNLSLFFIAVCTWLMVLTHQSQWQKHSQAQK
jgi:hypothetical protein